MPRFEPFAAIRYATDDLAPVIAPPYDVLSDADVDAFEAKSIHNVVRIDVPRGGEDRYDVAAKTMHAGWMRESSFMTQNPRSPSTACVLRTRPAPGVTSPGWSVRWRSLISRLVCSRTSGLQLPHPPIGST